MTIAELHANEELRQHEFPVAASKIFLGHAGVCPLPRRVAEAIAHYTLNATQGDQEALLPLFKIQQSRELAAKLLDAQADEIAFVGPTTLALNYVANGLSFRKHSNILIYHDDYPSNVYPWMALAERGVQVRLINVRELGKVRAVDVQGQVDENTKLVALASCHFISGWRINLPAIGKFLRQRGIWFCVDAIQTVGAFPTSVEHVDFLAADAHKWLLGPCAAGIFYVRKELQEVLKPTVLGWNNVRCPNYVAQEQIAFRSGAHRYEAGSDNLLGLVGLDAAMQLLLDFGIDNIAAELLRKREWLVPAIQEKGYTVLHPAAPPENASGIVTFFRPEVDMGELHKKLEAASIIASLRADRSGQQYIRLSPHFYNTDEELRRVIELL
ncbi:MAG TPA: aminotransferase class V-fold PLP-dependent enzyme [Candidatus Limnocylindria bacterium]|nr:aminotransferase class V-fold PLP-dependent enzyme [Candidatus Limnocylindria bacterium]